MDRGFTQAKRHFRAESRIGHLSIQGFEKGIDCSCGTIVVGYNKGWKQEVKLSHKPQEKFVKIPFAKLRDKIMYKARFSGIDALINEESHTSKCSALDYEPIRHHDEYVGLRGPSMERSNVKHYVGRDCKMKTTKLYQARGLLRTPRTVELMERKLEEMKVGFEYIHSDINGALNIGRKGAHEYFNGIGKREIKLSPIFVKNLSIKSAQAMYNTS